MRGSVDPPALDSTARSTEVAARSPLPFVLVNLAMSADGKIATANRAVSSFGSRRDFEHLLALRATADAVMCGARTVEADAVTLGPGPARFRRLRLRRGLAEYNLRVVVSGSGTLCPAAQVFRHRFSPIIVLTTQRAGRARLRRLEALADEVKVCGESEIDFHAALRWLRRAWEVRRLLCEGGGELNWALVRAGLVQELHLTVCPYVFGGRTAPTLAEGHGFEAVDLAPCFRLVSLKRVAEEAFLVFRRARSVGRSR
jgi:riboflavin-specific deaminase-like protein